MKYSLLSEIHLFHTSNIYLSEYPKKVKLLRRKINNVSQVEMQHLNNMLDNNEISTCEYAKIKEIIDFKKSKYHEMVNLM